MNNLTIEDLLKNIDDTLAGKDIPTYLINVLRLNNKDFLTVMDYKPHDVPLSSIPLELRAEFLRSILYCEGRI